MANASTASNGLTSPLYASESPSTASPGSRSVKRQKVTRSCDLCKARKRKCSGDIPCVVCRSSGTPCTYKAAYTRGKLVQPTPALDDTEGRTSRSMYFTPQSNTSFQYTLQSERNFNHSRAASPEGGSTFAGQYLGPTSPYTFLRRAWKRFEQDGSKLHHDQAASEEPSLAGSIFQFGDRPSQHDVSELVAGFRLPERDLTSAWLAQYFDLAMPTYRFLHYQSVAQWLEDYHEFQESGTAKDSLTPARQAVVLVVLATARRLNVQQKEIIGPTEVSWRESEVLFSVARRKLESETGRAKLASVQARLASCLFLLTSSRPNQAWYGLGRVIQLILSLGMHRANSGSSQDPIIRECRKRIFWAACTLDTYLAVLLGKPPLIHLDDVDQKLPDAIDDDDLSAGPRDGTKKDSIIRASILHAQITCIVKEAVREQYSVHRKTSQQKLDSAQRLNAETESWHASLPVVLSGAIHRSSLIPVFRRQITVLQLAHAHAKMVINRPSLLLETSQLEIKQALVETCVSAARSALDTVLASSFSKETFQAFWFTQFVSFSALSIIYIFLIQRKHGRLPGLKTKDFTEDELLRLADTVQKHLTEATQMNAPSLRYSIVLEELQQEVHRAIAKAKQRPPHINAIIEPESNYFPTPPEHLQSNVSSDMLYTDPMLEAFANFPMDEDLWMALDTLPFSDFGQLE